MLFHQETFTLFLWLLLFCLFSIAESQTKQGLQADFGSVTYAGGLVVQNNVAYITGQVGAYNCFVGAVSLASQKLQFLSKQIIEGAICQSLTMDPHNRLLLLATSEEGGLYTETRPAGTTKATQYGLIAPLLFNGDGSSATLMAGLLMHDDAVQYPKAIVLDPNHQNFAYVASMHSDSDQQNTHTTIDGEPNFTVLRKYGTSYFVTVQRIMMDEQYNFKKSSWLKEYAVKPDGAVVEEVVVSNMLWNMGGLVLVGYTKGSGDVFGVESSGFISGFITRFDPDTGLVQGTPRRISFDQDNQDSYLLDACSTSDGAIFVAALTGTDITIARINAMTFETEWVSPLMTSTSARGLICRVDDVKNVVYLAGVVTDGGTLTDSLSRNTTSLGKDDIFVAQFKSDNGSPTWMKQYGTTQQDRIADLQILPDNHGLVLYGDTAGSLMAQATGKNAIWLGYVLFNDAFLETTEVSNLGNDGGDDVRISQPVYDGDFKPAPPVARPPSSNPSKKSSSSSLPTDVLIALGIIAIGVFAIMAIVLHSRRQKERVTERALVFSYLQAFEPEDVDVRNSATGGWHGTYVGKLAHGRKSSSSSHSSIVKDSLFVDYDLGAPSEPSTRYPISRNFVIGDDNDDNYYRDDYNDKSPYGGRASIDDGDYEPDAVDIRIGNIMDTDEDDSDSTSEGSSRKQQWGKEITAVQLV
eukprot:scaffold5841_cov81-Cylindrotheca_fusiformis.AAC.1